MKKMYLGLLALCFVFGAASALNAQIINIVVVTTDGSNTVPGGMQSTVDQLAQNAPGATINITAVPTFNAAQTFRINHYGENNYMVAHGLYDENGQYTGELGDTTTQVFNQPPQSQSTIYSLGFTAVFHCGMPSSPGSGYKITNDDVGGDIGYRHSVTYNYSGKDWVEFCREALLCNPAPWFYCSKFGFWGLGEFYMDYDYQTIVQGAHPDANLLYQ